MAKHGNMNLFLGEFLKTRRKELQLSQEELAATAGLHRTYIGLLEHGKRSPTINTLFLIARVLRLKPSELVKHLENSV